MKGKIVCCGASQISGIIVPNTGCKSALRLATPQMKYTPVGVDIAKYLIQVHVINEYTGEVVDKQLRSKDFLTFFSNREPCLIGMEACGGSQHWARELEKTGTQSSAVASSLR